MASGAGKTHLAERPVDHEQLVETLPPPPPRDAVMIARRISMRIADGGPRNRLSGNQSSPCQVRKFKAICVPSTLSEVGPLRKVRQKKYLSEPNSPPVVINISHAKR